MKKLILSLGLSLIFVACTNDSQNIVTKLGLDQVFGADDTIEEIWIDVRPAKDYDKGTKPGAISLPIKEIKKGNFNFEGYEDVEFHIFGNFQRQGEEGVKLLGQAGLTKLVVEPGLKDQLAKTVKLRSLLAGDFIRALEDPKAFVIDTRDSEDFNKGHIEGAVNISGQDFADKLDQVPKKGEIYVIGYEDDPAFARALIDYREEVSLVLEGMDYYDYSPYMGHDEVN